MGFYEAGRLWNPSEGTSCPTTDAAPDYLEGLGDGDLTGPT